MLIGVISDSHNNISNLRKASDIMKERNVSAIIHCGDICRPSALKALETGIPIFCSFGNMDSRALLKSEFSSQENIKFFDFGQIEAGKKLIAFAHFPHLAEIAIKNGCDEFFHGHTHEKRKEMINGMLIANPGEIAGFYHRASLAIYDTEKNDIEFIDL